MRSLILCALALAVVATGPAAAQAQVVQLGESDGTVHLTNAPTDPRYQRLGIAPPPSSPAVRVAVMPPALGRTATSIGAQIRDAAERHGLPEELVTAVIRVESGFNPRAVSRKGARGLMQLMPATAAQYGIRDVFNPKENISGGVRHLRYLLDQFKGDVRLALAAYNAGENAVTRSGGVPRYRETQDYILKLEALYGRMGTIKMIGRTTIFRTVDKEGRVVFVNE